uniref:rRNA-processing protein EBP2 n=1 Tax=Rhizochromulina marina TaxID=1034831 RepID=A0A7S2S4R4_9STRA
MARELAFYEASLAAVKEGRERLKAQGISWKRPEDFFCEMIKSDTHMNRVKERLIFEQKKMEAFEQRKERQTQKKFSKAKANELQKERAASKKETLAAVKKWRDDNQERRKGGVGDDDGDLDRILSDQKPGKSRKRKALDRKYGFGGPKNKKATRNDQKSLNDMSGFSPRGMKADARRMSGGRGPKRSGGPSRPGKAARAQKRQHNRGGPM